VNIALTKLDFQRSRGLWLYN